MRVCVLIEEGEVLTEIQLLSHIVCLLVVFFRVPHELAATGAVGDRPRGCHGDGEGQSVRRDNGQGYEAG